MRAIWPVFCVIAPCVLFVAACKPRVSAQACAERVRELTARLELVRDASDLVEGMEVAPPSDVRHPIDEIGPVLGLTNGQTLLDGRLVADGIGGQQARADLRQDLETLRRNWDILHPGKSPQRLALYVLASPELPVSQLAAALSDLPHPYEVRLLVRSPSWTRIDPTPAGATAELRARIAAIEAAKSPKRTELIRDLLSAPRASCQAVADAFGRVSQADALNKGDVLINGIPPAVASCGCARVDIDALEAGLVTLMAPKRPPAYWLPLLINSAPASAPDEIILAPMARVGELVAVLGRAEAAGERASLPVPSPL